MLSHAPEINIRQQSILRSLLSATGKATLSELSDQTGLSARVIRYNMDVVRSWLKCADVNFINKPGYGMEVVASQDKKVRLLNIINNLEDCDIVLSRQERVRIILLYLLLVEEPISTKQLVEVEDFSRSTLFKDICEVEEWLENFGLELKRKSAKGLWIEGAEVSRRFAMVRLLRAELGDKNWYLLSNVFLTANKFNNSCISSRFELFINQLELPFCRQIVHFIEDNLGMAMSVISRSTIMVYLGVAIMAMRIGNIIEGEVDPEILSTDEYSITQIVGSQIEKKYDITISEKELEIIAALIISTKWDNIFLFSEEKDNPKQVPTKKSEQIASKIIDICSMRLHPMLKIDEILNRELSLHLDYTMFRLKHHVPLRNASLPTIQEKYPRVYQAAESSIQVLEQAVENRVPPEEVGFIAMYLLAGLERLRTVEDSRLSVIVANDGVRSKSSLLKSRLEYEFPNLRVAQIINTFDDLQEPIQNAEAIISTIPLENVSLPVIEVSPFLEIEDIKNIQRWVNEKSQVNNERRMTYLEQQNSLVDLVKMSHISLVPSVNSWQEIVQVVSQPLIQNQCIQPRYVDAMIDLIKNHGFYMYMGSGTLLLHAKPTDGINELCMSMMRLSKPFHFEAGPIPDVDVVFVLGATDDNSHLTALFQLNELVQIPAFMQDLRKAEKPGEIIHLLWEWTPKLTGKV
ncbi:MAG: mannitol operon transcriptional activator [Chloroflexota bacterium]|nr:mannitol operon transcriptional activator [Chloroflexota bacterium]